MKTKLQILAAFVALSSVALASDPASVSILGNENGVISTSTDNGLNFVTPTQGSMLTNATILSDGTVISNDNTATEDKTESTENMASYHHGSGGGDGDGISGKNIIYAGVGFVSLSTLLASGYHSAGYTESSIPVIDVAYERGLSSHFALGFLFEYEAATFSLTEPSGIDPLTGNTYNSYTDKLTLSAMGFGVSAAYHFGSSDKIDPFVCWALGYETFGAKFSTTDPNFGVDLYNLEPASISAGLPMFNMFFGCRFFFTNNIGAYVDAGWHGLAGSVVNIGLAAKF